jgi:glyoxylase I family protein
MHCFFEVGDGECLAFFQFAGEDDQAEFGPELPPSPFRHLAMKVDQATQDAIRDRLEAAGYFAERDTYPSTTVTAGRST